MQPDDFKALVETLSNVIDARAKTTETVIKAEIKASEERLRAEIKASEERTQADNLQLAGKVDTLAKNYKRRLEALEEETGTADPHKH